MATNVTKLKVSTKNIFATPYWKRKGVISDVHLRKKYLKNSNISSRELIFKKTKDPNKKEGSACSGKVFITKTPEANWHKGAAVLSYT